MSSLPIIALAVIAAVQTPSSSPAPPEAGAPVRTTLKVESQPETPIGAQPFQKLFTQSSDAADAIERARHALEAQKEALGKTAPKIVCGMTVLPVDPRIDPKMIRRPSDSATTFHLKRIPPAVCAE